MTEDELIRRVYSQSFSPEVSDTIETELFDHYNIYKRKGNKFRCFCTKCENEFVGEKIKHNAWVTCPNCKSSILSKSSGYSRKFYQCRNFVIGQRISETEIMFKAVIVTQQFLEPESREGFWFCDDPQIFEYTYDVRFVYYFKYGKSSRKFKKYHDFEDNYYKFKENRNVTEPNFYSNQFGYHDNSYVVVGIQTAVENTKFQYVLDAIQDTMLEQKLIMLLSECAKHPQIEYMIKTGYEHIVEDILIGRTWGTRFNWKSNDIKKVFGFSKLEFEIFKGSDCELIKFYKELRKIRPDKPEVLQYLAEKFIHRTNELKYFLNFQKPEKLKKYLEKNEISAVDYIDYFRACEKLKYNLGESDVAFPKNFTAAHDRVSQVIVDIKNAEIERQIAERQLKLKKMIYSDDKYQIVIPKDMSDIVEEGKVLHHCVGGYAKRHAEGRLTILFLRKKDALDERFYTIEVSSSNQIVQCRGFKNNLFNNPKPAEIEEFEKKFSRHLARIK